MKVTLNKDGTPRKSGSGRKKGATSFTNISIADLKKFCGSATLIPVSRVWIEQMGASVSESLQHQSNNKTQSQTKKFLLLCINNSIDILIITYIL